MTRIDCSLNMSYKPLIQGKKMVKDNGNVPKQIAQTIRSGEYIKPGEEPRKK